MKNDIQDIELNENRTFHSLPMETLLSPTRIGQYRFDAPYQRGQQIWDLKMKQNLIKSIFAGIPFGAIHLVFLDNGNWNILDGKSRIEAVRDFYNNLYSVNWQ